MNIDTPNNHIESIYYIQFRTGLEQISAQVESADAFHLALYHASMVSMMEKYLFDVFINEIETSNNAFLKMSQMDRFKNLSYKLSVILNNEIKKIVINTVKNMIWHRLNDIEPLFKNVMGIKFNISKKLTDIIKDRHDIVHRNGYNLTGGVVDLSRSKVNDANETLKAFILDIDKKYHNYKETEYPHI